MPFYDYKCTECDTVLTDIQRNIKDNVETMDCPKCGELMKQVYGNYTFDFKGSGFYQTDYKNKGTSGTAKENKD